MRVKMLEYVQLEIQGRLKRYLKGTTYQLPRILAEKFISLKQGIYVEAPPKKKQTLNLETLQSIPPTDSMELSCAPVAG